VTCSQADLRTAARPVATETAHAHAQFFLANRMPPMMHMGPHDPMLAGHMDHTLPGCVYSLVRPGACSFLRVFVGVGRVKTPKPST
jgi:hypothetical protein